MVAGTEVIGQAVLWNPEKQTYGVPDLLVRSDVLNRLVPHTLDPAEEHLPAPDLPGANWHYRVVDIKFATLDLLADGSAGAGHLPFMAQVWVYNEALGRIQGYRPPCGYLLGRGWKQRGKRGTNALAKLARVDDDLLLRDGRTLERVVRDACDWIRRVRRNGATWQVLPAPSVPELRPNMNAKEDQPWHTAKSEIAQTLKELTLLPGVSRDHRDGALDAGLAGWDDPQCSAEALDVTGSKRSQILERSLEANQSAAGGVTVFPVNLPAGRGSWRKPGPVEFFVDFETVNALDDDFSQFPEKGGIPIIYMIGCGCEGCQQTEGWSNDMQRGPLECRKQFRPPGTQDWARRTSGARWLSADRAIPIPFPVDSKSVSKSRGRFAASQSSMLGAAAHRWQLVGAGPRSVAISGAGSGGRQQTDWEADAVPDGSLAHPAGAAAFSPITMGPIVEAARKGALRLAYDESKRLTLRVPRDPDWTTDDVAERCCVLEFGYPYEGPLLFTEDYGVGFEFSFGGVYDARGDCHCDCCYFEQYVMAKTTRSAWGIEFVALDDEDQFLEDANVMSAENENLGPASQQPASVEGSNRADDPGEYYDPYPSTWNDPRQDSTTVTRAGGGVCLWQNSDAPQQLNLNPGRFRQEWSFLGVVLDACHNFTLMAIDSFDVVVSGTMNADGTATLDAATRSGWGVPLDGGAGSTWTVLEEVEDD